MRSAERILNRFYIVTVMVLNCNGAIDINGIEGLLGVPVVPISAAKNEGVNELIEHAIHVARFDECPGRLDFCDENASKRAKSNIVVDGFKL